VSDQGVDRASSAANSELSRILKHEFDRVRALPASDVEARAPRLDEVPEVLAMATAAIGAPLAHAEAVTRILNHDPDSIWIVEREGRILGGVGFLHLSQQGMRQLMAGTIDFRAPDPSLLCAPGQRPAGIYVWALFGRGRAGIGVSLVIERLRRGRFRNADLWAIPHTGDGQRLLRCLGFEPAFSETTELYRYVHTERRVS
jgi:hypothetical protein